MKYTDTALRENSGDSVDDQASFDSGHLLDVLIEILHLKNDAALCRVLNVGPPLISKIRNGSSSISAALLIRMHEDSGLTVGELRALMGDHRKNFGVND